MEDELGKDQVKKALSFREDPARLLDSACDCLCSFVHEPIDGRGPDVALSLWE